MLGDKFGRQKVLSVTIIIMALSTFCYRSYSGYDTIGIWATHLTVISKTSPKFSQLVVSTPGAAIFVAEYSPDRKRGFMGSWLDFGSLPASLWGRVLLSLSQPLWVKLHSMSGDGVFHSSWHYLLGLIGLYLRHALEENGIQQHVDEMNSDDRKSIENPPRVSLREIAQVLEKFNGMCGLSDCDQRRYYMLLTYMPSYLSHNLNYSADHGVLIIIAIMIGCYLFSL